VGVKVGVAYSRNKLALRTRLRNLNLNLNLILIVSEISTFKFTIFEVCGRFVGIKVGVGNFFLGQSKDIDEKNTFQLKFVF